MLLNSCYVSQGSEVKASNSKWPTRSFKGSGNGAIRYMPHMISYLCSTATVLHS